MRKSSFIVVLYVLILLISGCHDGYIVLTDSESETTLLLNEFKTNIPEDIHALQYIELRGSESYVVKNTYLVVVDGDEDSEGLVDYACNLDGVTIGSNGLIMIKNEHQYNNVVSKDTTVINEPLIKNYADDHKYGLLEYDAVMYALIETSAKITIGDDLDSNMVATISELERDPQMQNQSNLL